MALNTGFDNIKNRPSHTQIQMANLKLWNSAEAPGLAHTRSEISQHPVAEQRPPVRQRNSGGGDSDSRSRMSNTSGPAEEAEAYSIQRMLQDSTGRLLYVGDSATLSYLQLIRMLVESIAGKSRFTMDPKRHMIMEARIEPPPSNMAIGVLPERRTADVLIEAYFVNTTGLVEVFDRKTFLDQVDQCYNDPLTVDPSVLCQLNLVFAIGLVLCRPDPRSEEEAIIKKLCANKDINRAEVFFRNAKSLADPVSGFEDADFWSVQALLLMALYMLSVSKRNAAYAYYGMAVRSAFALGLHREEDALIFSKTEIKVRRNLWRALFVLDRFLSASLGRPTAISEDDCSEHALDAPETSFDTEADKIASAALDAAVRTCRVIGATLKQVYSKRKISTTVAQQIASQLEGWNQSLHQSLHWKRALDSSIPASHGIAILHINLLHCHSIILLTRPFFLYILKAGVTHKPSRLSQRMESFAQTCVEAAQHTLAVAKAAMDGKYLPQCNPFVIYFVFAAGLIVLSNEFASLYHNPDADLAISSCISILTYCAEHDPQAERVSFIVEAFHEANLSRSVSARKISFPGRKVPIITPTSSNPQHDPMAHFFARSHDSPVQQQPTLAPIVKNERPLLSTAHTIPVPALVSSVLQQPSPDATGSSPVNTALPSGMPGMDALHAAEAEFDFDSLWPTWHASSGPMAISHHVESTNYGNYSLGPHPIALGSVLAANVPVPIYPAGDFR
ncbi:hypothetical protein JX265_000486 [Neoarthrinium moseri]|uniref:Xylanolytic transcriptional activator regulatory domain-containing protein n=1 Tax=Neoarthrinium moseri TaxID=1658444 RepID=A0A9P9WYL1_9PEZI|nr:hypothetical protein JX265_000486 [Neoarthrinium moseri]